MANATQLPISTNLFLGQWATKDDPAPRLAAPIDADDTTITVSAPFKDATGTIVTGGFLMGIKKENGWTENVWIPLSAGSADGLTFTGCVRGIKPAGYDYTVGSATYADSHDADEIVGCVIPAILPELIRSALQGLIATGAVNFIIGADADATMTIKRSTGAGTSVGFLRWNTTTDKTEYSNDGSSWTAIDDTVSSVLFKISATDTTPAYALTKLIGGTGIIITQTGTGGNETLVFTTSLPSTFTTHTIYTPAYLTGGSSAESNYAIWDNVTDGSFRVTIDGTAYNVDAINFTGDTDMDDVAATIQAAIRTATGSTETCVWSTDHFIFTSADTTSSSEFSLLETSTGTVGTDISGAGASDWLDADTGNGVATGPVLDPSQDAGKVLLMGADGYADAATVGTGLIVEAGEAVDGSSTPQAVCISDGSNSKTAGRFYKADADDLTSMYTRVIGFIDVNAATIGNKYTIKRGLIGGFTGLTQGVDYFLSTTAGGISKTITSNPSVKVGKAVSATEIQFIDDSPIVQSYLSTSTGAVNQNAYIDVAITIGFRPKAIVANWLLFGGTSLSWGQWNNGTEYSTHIAFQAGALQNGSAADLGQVYVDYGAGDYWQCEVQSFTDNTVTLRLTARGGNLNSTIVSQLLIFG